MKIVKKYLFVIILIAVLAVIIIPKINFTSEQGAEGRNSPLSMRKTSVNISIIKPKAVQNKIFSNGTLISNEEVDIRSEISGKITKILFEEGRFVKENDLLIKINDSELQATLKKNRSREMLARDREFRYKQLLEKSLTSQQEYDVALSELNSVLADIEFTEAQIAKTEIRAPFDGIIGLRSVSVGSYISPSTKIVTLQNVNPIKVDFSVPQKYSSLLRQGKSIIINLPSTNKSYNGVIYALEPKIDLSTRTVQVRAQIPNTKHELTPGAYVEIYIILEDISNAIMVPTDVVIPDVRGEYVFVNKNGFAIPQKVETGIRTENEIQILNGLNMGDSLIVSGIIQLRPNTPVKLNAIN